MRTTLWLATAALAALMATPSCFAAAQNSQQSSKSTQESQAAKSSASQDPLAAAARKAREQRKDAPKAAKVFTNDNLPTQGGISTVGEASSATAANPEKAQPGASAASTKMTPAEWRAKFAALHQKLQQDQSELSIMQRELGQQAMQYYGGDPQKAAQDQASGQPMGSDYNKKKAAIDAKQKQVDADQQAISDAESALRQAGGDPGWAR